MEEDNNNTMNSRSCIIDYPGNPPRNLARLSLSTRLRLLVVDANNQLNALVESGMRPDSMLDIQHAATLPEDVSRFQLALVYLDNDDSDHQSVLETLAAGVGHLIIVCPTLTTAIAKLAVKFKVDELLTLTDLQENLYPALMRVADAVSQSVSQAPLTTIINGKAGSGATFITCCLSEAFTRLSDKELALIDADFNYASLAHGLHIDSEFSIDEAIGELDKLDEAAIRSMMADRKTIHLIGNAPFSRLKSSAHTPQQLDNLCWKIRQTFDEVFVDMSKGLEHHTMPLLSQSTTILVVMQLTVASMRETKALLSELRARIELDNKQVAIVVNRYVAGKGEISLDDVSSVLNVSEIFTISNNYELARLRTDLGRPLDSLANHKVIEKELAKIARYATASAATPQDDKRTGFFKRLLRSK